MVKLELPKGEIRGVGVVRDKDGNIKDESKDQEKLSGNADTVERNRERGG